MQKAFCFNAVLGPVLKNLEVSPHRVFTVQELSRDGFTALKDQGLVDTVYRDLKRTPVYLDHDGQPVSGFVRKIKNVLWWHPDDAGAPRIAVTEDQVTFAEFNKAKLIEAIRQANSLSGKPDHLSERISFIGQGDGVGFFLGFFNSDSQAEELLAVWSKCARQSAGIVLCPTYEIASQALSKRLEEEQIYCIGFDEAFGDGFKIDTAIVSKRVQSYVPHTAPETTPRQAADYKSHGYLCYDRVHIPGTVPMSRSNLIIINGIETKIPDSDFVLFMEFVATLKKGKGGWLIKRVAPGKHQPFARLRTVVQGSLLKKDAKEFIQNNPPKQYRISTHPDFVTYGKKKLLGHPNATVKALARKLP